MFLGKVSMKSSKKRRYCNTEGFFLKLFLSISILDSSQKWSGIPNAGSKLTGIPNAEGEGVTPSLLATLHCCSLETTRSGTVKPVNYNHSCEYLVSKLIFVDWWSLFCRLKLKPAITIMINLKSDGLFPQVFFCTGLTLLCTRIIMVYFGFL